jgi:hypothetical protein
MENSFEVGDLVYHKTDLKRRHPLTVTHVIDNRLMTYEEFFEREQKSVHFTWPSDKELRKMFEEVKKEPVKCRCEWINYHGKVMSEYFLSKVLLKDDSAHNSAHNTGK